MSLPVIAITMGDASGIGPEIIIKALNHKEIFDICKPLVIGSASRLEEVVDILHFPLKISAISSPDQAKYSLGVISCIDIPVIPRGHPFGVVSKISGEGSYRFIEKAVEIIELGQADALCTAPLNKEALHLAGHNFPGHTEMLAFMTHTPEVSMMLSTPNIRVAHVTTHIGLIDAIKKIEPGLVERTIGRAHEALKRSGIKNPKIGVCAINPHAGENGLFGQGEEEKKIIPAVKACLEKGWNVEGPVAADALFYRAGRGDFDIVIAMYHDQGHIPVKVMGIADGVNITIGMPLVRTSVDHGTAFDIAGKGIADEASMMEALRQAVIMAPKE